MPDFTSRQCFPEKSELAFSFLNLGKAESQIARAADC